MQPVNPAEGKSIVRKRVVAFVLTAIILAVAADMALIRFSSIGHAASVESVEINSIFRVLLLIAVPIFVLVVVGMVYAIWFFRRRRTDTGEGHSVRTLPPLEAAWTFLPLLIVIAVSVYGALVLDRMIRPSENELEIRVIAKRYLFQFEYPDYNINTLELGLPVNQKVHLTLTSLDVVHDFWVPKFGPKEDCIPGMTTELRLTPTELGTFSVLCSQLCGPGHTYMTAPVIVMSQSDFEAWVKKQQSPPATTTAAGLTAN